MSKKKNTINEPVNNTSNMPVIMMDNGDRLYFCEFRNNNSYIIKAEYSDYKPIIQKLWRDYKDPASNPRTRQKAEEQLRYYNEYLRSVLTGQFKNELENVPQEGKRALWRENKELKRSAREDVMRSGMRRQRKDLPEHYKEASGERSITGAFIDYMELYHPRGLKLVGDDFIPASAILSTPATEVICSKPDEYVLVERVVYGQTKQVKQYQENKCQCTRCLNNSKPKAKKARRMVGTKVDSLK